MPTVWWVNHGEGYDQERHGGFISAPDVTGQPPSLRELASGGPRPGDASIHFAGGSIRAVGILRSSLHREDRPTELPEGVWVEQRRVLEVEYHDLASPVKFEDIPARNPDAGPFDRTGAVTSGYLHAVSPEFAATLYQSFRARWPIAWLPSASGSGR